IPYQQLSPEALRGILEEYATRGGFEADTSIDSRIEEMMEKLRQKKIKIVFDPKTGLTNVAARK
ncbi:MAG TPA: YheU family protein, partial [Phycisphaerales bacterium]|nr:YheU family protein [Phycisphaerales bacterium]